MSIDPTNPYGMLVAPPMVSDALEATLRKWTSDYLGEVLDQAGGDRQGLEDPADLMHSVSGDWLNEGHTHLVVVLSPSTLAVTKVAKHYQITYRQTVRMIVSQPSSVDGREALREAQFYIFSLAAAACHKGLTFDDLPYSFGAAVDLDAIRCDTAASGDERSLIIGECDLSITVKDAMRVNGGPATPSDPGTRPPGDPIPTADEFAATLHKVPLPAESLEDTTP